MPIQTQLTPIGLTLPIRNGENGGYFEQSYDSFTQTRTNIINLLRTRPGERRMQPTFGSRLWNVIFEPNDGIIIEKVNSIIREDIQRWIPGVSVKDVTVKYYSEDETNASRDIYKLYIAVQFIVNSINQEDLVEIYLDQGKI
jgi:phage baseplate assembly protein W